MNTLFASVSTALVLGAFPWNVSGDDQFTAERDGKGRLVTADNTGNTPPATDPLGFVMKGGQLLGATVTSSANENLGKIEDLAVDLESGRIVEVILSLGDKLVALPPSVFAVGRDHHVLANTDQETLKAAAPFDISHWEDSLRPAQVAKVYRDFDAVPYVSVVPLNAKPSAAEQLGHVERASKLSAFNVKSREGVSIGKVNNLLIDLPAERVLQVVVSTGEFLGVHEALNYVPPAVLHYNAERDGLTWDISKETLSQAPRVQGNQWPGPSDRQQYTDAYNYYHIQPYFATNRVEVSSRRP